MYTEKELLKLTGKLAMTAHMVIDCQAKDLSYFIGEMEKALNLYDQAILENVKSK
jgi:hypothetical protein